MGVGRQAQKPALFEYLGVHGELEEFRGESSHPAVHFLECFLEVAGACEDMFDRNSEWPGLRDRKVTHVERLFGFVLEQRSGCHSCGVAGLLAALRRAAGSSRARAAD